MAARPFPRLSIVRIIAWIVKRGSTPTIEPITVAKEDAAVLVGALIVRIMCVVPAQRNIAPYVVASFMEPNVSNIM